ncbi:DUF6183 family protein [Streptomyces mirabilis]|uniref:DUF6183 family protein n=1 Tax=Streptomyces mirabilis TaxID=68239 RepID=UPI0036DAA62F
MSRQKVRLVWGQAEQRAAQGDASYVSQLGMQLADLRAAAVEQVREYERQLLHVVRVLALTPGRGSLVQLLRLLDEKRPSTAGSGLLPRFVASLLAEHQQVTDLAATVFDGCEWERLDELRACLFQELVLRGVDIDAFPALRSWPLVRPGWHPLAWLPVHRRDLEANADFPSRSIRGSVGGCRVDYPTRAALARRHHVRPSGPPFATSPPRTYTRASSPPYRQGSEVTAAPGSSCWTKPSHPSGCPLCCRPCPWHASPGSAAWRSMAGLSGAPEGASADEVERHARQSTWFHFEADTDWFHNGIGSDYGIAALPPTAAGSPCWRRRTPTRDRAGAPRAHRADEAPGPVGIPVVTGNPPGRQLLAEMAAHAAGRTPPTPGRASNRRTDS